MSPKILRHILLSAMTAAMVLAAVIPVGSAQAKTTYKYVKSCTYKYVKVNKRWTKKWTCQYKKVAVVVKVAPKSVAAYKPGYNLMTTTASSRGTHPAGVTAICGDGHYVYGTVTTSSCAAHHGVACQFKGQTCTSV